MKRIEFEHWKKLDEAAGYFYEDEAHNVYRSSEGGKLWCMECHTQTKVDEDGYFYCPKGCTEGCEYAE